MAAAATSSAARVVGHARAPRCSRRRAPGRLERREIVRRSRPSAPGPASPTLLSMPAPTSCTRGAGLPGPRLDRQRLDDHRAQLVQRAVLGQLGPVPRRARCRHDRVRQLDRADVGREHGAGPVGGGGWALTATRTRDTGAGPAAAAPPAGVTARRPCPPPPPGPPPASSGRAPCRPPTAVRMCWPSARGPRPRGVLTTSCTLPWAMSSTASDATPSSPTLATRVSTTRPAERR